MRKFYLTLGCSLALLPAIAQDPQLPNSGFEEPFVDCIPWTSTDNTKTTGTTPENWTISQVVGIIALGGMGATEVGGMVEGYESTQAVTVYNKPNSAAALIGMKQIVPGYVTLGTTWSTSIMGKENDGGTFGGIDFTGRPTEITFMYKRELGEEGNTQPATVVVYLWKGTYTQKDVPGDIPLGKPTLVDMVNRDRNILGIETAKGGEVTASDDAELIGKAILNIDDVTSEWKQGKVTIEYLSDATPEHINVIFAANDYFGDAADIEAGNSLTIDNVYCVYGDTENTGEEYNGQLEVEMDGDSLTDEPVNTSIFITENTDGTFTFLLPDLTLGDIGSVGDIKLDGVTRTTTDGVDTYTCHDPALSLLDGELEADVTLNGTVDGKGAASFVIDVVWMGMPIKCTFNGQGAAAINGIEIDSANAPVEFYNLNGVRVSGDALAPGIYIRRQGNDVKKILVR